MTMELPTLANPATWYLLLAGGAAVVLALAALLVTVTALLAPERRPRQWHRYAHRTPPATLPRSRLPDESRMGHAPGR
jgi:hypothetical protein